MDSPLKFPSDAEVIAEEAARFRALSPEERMRVIRDLLNAGSLIMRQSPKAEFMRAYADEQEELAQKGGQRVYCSPCPLNRSSSETN